jgi:hypothetical protein
MSTPELKLPTYSECVKMRDNGHQTELSELLYWWMPSDKFRERLVAAIREILAAGPDPMRVKWRLNRYSPGAEAYQNGVYIGAIAPKESTQWRWYKVGRDQASGVSDTELEARTALLSAVKAALTE